MFGARGVACLEATEVVCCGGSNPLGQIFFAILFAGCYVSIHTSVFPLIDGVEIAGWHRATGAATAAAVLFFFLKTCYSDPGVVTSANVDAHMALYSPDGVLFPAEAKVCETCGRPKPPRSKHCNATRGCVARFDHWCLWVNNALGLANTRWFLAFLVATTGACVYGAALAARVVAADMRRRGAWETTWHDPKAGRRVRLADSSAVLVRFLFARYTATAVGAFLGAASFIVAGFTVAQLLRVARGETTNEGWKARDAKEAGWVVPRGYRPYDHGWRQNFGEVLFPGYYLERALQRSRKRG